MMSDLPGGLDTEVLESAAQERRVLLTHDVNTMTRHAKERVSADKSISGVAVVPQTLAIGIAIDHLAIIAE
jgi:hypothetical protein